ncbi:MAG: SH3 domain-containing protein [Alicyclobacillus sp.]|nr:SH3 domain-containing protein [Alicyclobacillus sp.]
MAPLLPHVTPDMLDPAFWIAPARCPQRASWSQEACNKALAACPHLHDIRALAAQIRAGEQADLPRSLVKPPVRDSRTLYDEQGQLWDDAVWASVQANVNWDDIGASAAPAFTVRRAALRRWPSDRKAFRSEGEREFDQFQETALHVLEPLLVLGSSNDGDWLYVQSAIYRGWVAATDVALTDWQTFDAYADVTQHPHGFLVITGLGVQTEAQPYDPSVSRQPVEFAAYLPLVGSITSPIGGQSPVGQWAVLWPVRSASGQLELRPAFIRRQAPARAGFLPFTPESIVHMAFQLLGERYGWGDSFGCHDCSSTVMDVYRTVGVRLPRDAGTQEQALPVGHTRRVSFTASMERADRHALLETLCPGDPLYMPGHTMLYLGQVAGRHFMIHDFSGYADEKTPDKEASSAAAVGEVSNLGADIVTIPVNEVMVSSLDILTREGQTYLEALTGALRLL